MTVCGYPLSSLIPWDFQPVVRFGSALSGSRFDAPRSVSDTHLSDQIEQKANRGVATITQPSRGPFAPQLHRVLETQMTWMHGRGDCGLRHEQSDQVIGEKVNPDFLFVHLRGVATQLSHLQGRLDRSQIQLHVPALLKELPQRPFADLAGTQKAADEDLLSHLHFTQGEFIGQGCIVLRTPIFYTQILSAPASC